MIVSEVNKILKDKNMQNQNTNFKIVKKKIGGSKRSSKPTNRELILQLSKKLDTFIDYVLDVFKRNNLK